MVAANEAASPPLRNQVYVMKTAKDFQRIYKELQSAREKFPDFNSAHEGWAIIKEELDELWEVVKENQATNGRNARLRKEAIQVAAMAVRFLQDMKNFKN